MRGIADDETAEARGDVFTQDVDAFRDRRRNHHAAPILGDLGKEPAFFARGLDKDNRDRDSSQDLGRVTTDRLAVPVQNLELARSFLEGAEPVGNVRELRRQLQSSLLTTAANQDLRAAALDRPRDVARPVDSVVVAGEARPLLREHRPSDRQRLFETIFAPADGRELEAVALVLRLVPGGADTENRAPFG